jgi:hypothetical protein
VVFGELRVADVVAVRVGEGEVDGPVNCLDARRVQLQVVDRLVCQPMDRAVRNPPLLVTANQFQQKMFNFRNVYQKKKTRQETEKRSFHTSTHIELPRFVATQDSSPYITNPFNRIDEDGKQFILFISKRMDRKKKSTSVQKTLKMLNSFKYCSSIL